MVCSMAGVSIDRLDSLVKSKSWYGENHGEPLDNKRECVVCSKVFVPRTNCGKLCSPECRKIGARRRAKAHKAMKKSAASEFLGAVA